MHVIDDREKFANAERFGEGIDVIVDNIPTWLENSQLAPTSYVVVVTRGHTHDLDAMRVLAARPLRYRGLIGSKAKVKRIFDALIEEGVAAEVARGDPRPNRPGHRRHHAAGNRRQHRCRADCREARQDQRAERRRGHACAGTAHSPSTDLTRLALALAFLTAALGIRFGTFTAGGADSYGYVSQADLWLQRTLIIDEPLADEAPWRNANWTLTPFGYRPGDRRGTMVPTYSPGLPMVMAAFKACGGAERRLLCRAAAWRVDRVAHVCARRASRRDRSLGCLAATALLASPPFLFQLMWPMSDVPAAAWWLLSIVLALRGTHVDRRRGRAGGRACDSHAGRTSRCSCVPLLAFVVSRPSANARPILCRRRIHVCDVAGSDCGCVHQPALVRVSVQLGIRIVLDDLREPALLAQPPELRRVAAGRRRRSSASGLAAPLLFHRRSDRSRAPSRSSARIGSIRGDVVSLVHAVQRLDLSSFPAARFSAMLALAASVFVLVVPAAPRWQRPRSAALAATLAIWGVWVGRFGVPRASRTKPDTSPPAA